MPAQQPLVWSVFVHSHRRLVDESWIDAAQAVTPSGLDHATLQADLAALNSVGAISAMRVEFDAGAAGLGYLIGCSEMGLKGRWLFTALLAAAIGALAGCAATGPLSGDPCWGFFACTGWH
jgi:hypothetical protein